MSNGALEFITKELVTFIEECDVPDSYVDKVEASLQIIRTQLKRAEAADGLVDALKLAQHQFYMYQRNHLSKTPPDYAKAETNQAMADQCAKALQQYKDSCNE